MLQPDKVVMIKSAVTLPINHSTLMNLKSICYTLLSIFTFIGYRLYLERAAGIEPARKHWQC
jgi:hypothetical protein